MKIYLGKDENGQVTSVDLRDIKHLLVAGKTGSGKTEFIGAIIRDIIKRYGSNKVGFCYFSDCWFLLKNEIPIEYRFFGAEKSVAKNEIEADALLSDVLNEMHGRIANVRQNSNEILSSDKSAPEIIMIFDNNAFYYNDKINEKLAEILKNGSNAGIHIVFSLQYVLKSDEQKIKLFPSVACGRLNDEKQSKIILGTGGAEELRHFEFILKPPVNCMIKIRR